MRSLPHTLAPARLRRGSRPLLAFGLLLVLSGGQANAQSPWGGGGPDPQRREAMLRQQAEAMARLSGRQRREYFEARRDLERRQSNQRLDQLSQAERCLEWARGVTAVQRCQRSQLDQRLQQRSQEMADLAALQRRFGLPGWDNRDREGWKSRPAPRPLGPSSYGAPPYAPQPYGAQPYGQPFGGGGWPGGGFPGGGLPGGGSSWMGDLLQSLLAF